MISKRENQSAEELVVEGRRLSKRGVLVVILHPSQEWMAVETQTPFIRTLALSKENTMNQDETDIVLKLQQSAENCANEDRLDLSVQHQVEMEAAVEIKTLRAAFLACLQAENECAKKGRLCGPSDMCGCALEMEDYVEDARASALTNGERDRG